MTTYIASTPDGDMLGKRVPHGSGGWNDYYFLHDERGSIVALTDASGTVVDTFSYDPYGNQITATGSVGNSFGFLGGFAGGGVPTLIQLGERYYDPTIGRFTQQDPLGGGYGYTSGDPINFSDPSGMKRSRHHVKRSRRHRLAYSACAVAHPSVVCRRAAGTSGTHITATLYPPRISEPTEGPYVPYSHDGELPRTVCWTDVGIGAVALASAPFTGAELAVVSGAAKVASYGGGTYGLLRNFGMPTVGC